MNQTDNSPLPEGECEWRIEQYKFLTEERRDFNKHMWQTPLAALGIVGLILNVAKDCVASQPTLARLLFLVSAGVCLYSALLLGRLHKRRDGREERIIALEKIITLGWRISPHFSSLVDVSKPTPLEGHAPQNEMGGWINVCFGRISTSGIGIVAILLVSLALVTMSACPALWSQLVSATAQP